MPKVVFVNEHRVVDVPAGRSVWDAAREAGVTLDVHRFQGGYSCGGHGVCRACLCWVEEGEAGAAGPRSWLERLRGLRGWRRLACRARVNGPLKVYSVPAAAERVNVARPIAPPPSPVADPSAPRKPEDAASTAAHLYGHPAAVGRGGEPSAPVPPAAPSHPNAARPVPTAPPPPLDSTEGTPSKPPPGDPPAS
ncbi:MAG TPA: 2Fe-2S iron-sulfur cluster binding domain-containing protein [Polyangiaceae bacterium]